MHGYIVAGSLTFSDEAYIINHIFSLYSFVTSVKRLDNHAHFVVPADFVNVSL